MPDDRKTYYDRATSWALDDQAKARTDLRQARVFSSLAILIAVLEAFTLLLLIPLKSVQVVPVLVDRQTGFVEALNPKGRIDLNEDAALTQSLLAQYVIARESFDINRIAHDYNNVSLWSTGAARQEYLASASTGNPRSPLRTLPRSADVDVQVKSVSPLGPKAALVRFRTTRRDQPGAAPLSNDWAAVLAYRFSNAQMAFKDRLNNPLGFQVFRYHKDPETLLPPDPTPAVAVVVPAAEASIAPTTSAGPVAAPTPPAPTYPITNTTRSLPPPVGAVPMAPRHYP